MKIKTLHLASFTGNIGDNANHLGSSNLFKKHGLPNLDITRLEIRDFFRKKIFFDENFINLANSYDLLIIGGGNYFELWPPETKSGTTIDLGPVELNLITTPIIFYSLGVDIGQGCSQENVEKFDSFLKSAIKLERIFLSVRNDGAIKNLETLYEKKYNQSIFMIPDGGFFANYQGSKIIPFTTKSKKIGVNIAGDMLETRTGPLGSDKYIQEISNFIALFLQKHCDYNLIFFPHIFRDIEVISKILNILPDQLVRERIEVCQYGQGDEYANYIFGQYNLCDLIIGNRFHSNVVPFGMGIPTIGLCNYLQIKNLYEEIELSDRVVHCNEPGFSVKLLKMVDETLKDYNSFKDLYQEKMNKVTKQAQEGLSHLKEWFDLNF